jgi:2-polyprenyl-3-methyl-5-hydroxy-6-metoxy-1,4-benzoquinol methylase
MTFSTLDQEYQDHLHEEASLWNRTARAERKQFSPDYRYYRSTLPYRIYRQRYVAATLSLVKEGARVLELGAYNGWFSLELARRGAHVDAHDIADEALRIGKRYFEKIRQKEQIAGTIAYHVTDLNAATFSRKPYDVVVIRNVLHHIANLDDLLEKVKHSLKPGGMLIVDDALPCRRREALVVGMLLMLLPTEIPYSQNVSSRKEMYFAVPKNWWMPRTLHPSRESLGRKV